MKQLLEEVARVRERLLELGKPAACIGRDRSVSASIRALKHLSAPVSENRCTWATSG
jgi:hypothetical protein